MRSRENLDESDPQVGEAESLGSLALPELFRDLEGSTHGGPRHAMLFETIRDRVSRAPMAALNQLDEMPTSAKTVLLMVVSGLGRVMLPSILSRLSDSNPTRRRDAAMVLCIWGTRGLLFGGDRDAIERSRSLANGDVPDEQTDRLIDETLARIRT